MNETETGSDPSSLDEALSIIRAHAERNGLTPRQVTDIHSTGIVAARVLQPSWASATRVSGSPDKAR